MTTAAAPTATPDESSAVKGRSVWMDAWLRLRRNKLAMVCLAIVVAYSMVAILVAAGVLADQWNQTIGPSYAPPSWEYPFGTDIFGRSVLSKTIYGAKISLSVALFSSVIAIAIGVPLGALAGYFRGVIDDGVVWLYSTLMSIPGYLLILAFAFVLQGATLFGYPLEGLPAIYLALGLTSWVSYCRLIRGETLKHKDRDYVVAAAAYGASRMRIIFRHIFPNVVHLVIITFSLQFVFFIQAEVILSFLGLGPADQPSWGKMISAARLELSRGVWWQLIAATFAIFFIALPLNILGDALRDALDPKLRE